MTDTERSGKAADEQSETDSDGSTQAVTSTYKVLGQLTEAAGVGVLGQNDAGSGTPIGVEGVVPNATDAGYGLATPHDVRVAGVVDTDETDFVVEAGTTATGAATNVVHGHTENEVLDGAQAATIGGGGYADGTDFEANRVADDFGTVGGGRGNLAGSPDAAANDTDATVAGGTDNIATATASTVGGGVSNQATGETATVAGGNGNEARESTATIAGGWVNEATGGSATVGGGHWNHATAAFSTIGGGGPSDTSDATSKDNTNNAVYDDYGTVSGGGNNQAGSDDETANATHATVVGGVGNTADGQYSTAAGRNADANGFTGAFVVGDGTSATITASQEHETVFQSSRFRIAGGLPPRSGSQVGIESDGQLVDTGASSARYKTNIEPLDAPGSGVLDLEPKAFDYRDTGVSGVGFIAESVAETITELVVADENGRPDGVRYDRLGVYLVPEVRENRERTGAIEEAVDGHGDRLDELEAENEALRERNEELASRVAALEERVGGSTTTEQPSTNADD